MGFVSCAYLQKLMSMLRLGYLSITLVLWLKSNELAYWLQTFCIAVTGEVCAIAAKKQPCWAKLDQQNHMPCSCAG